MSQQNVFGKYRFYTTSTNQTLPAIRIHIFKGVNNGVPLDIVQLCNTSQADLLTHPYLLGYNNLSSTDLWRLDYTFALNEDGGNNQQNANTYYILYTYRFNYSGGSSTFEAEYEFIPQEITLNSNYLVDSASESYFRYSPQSNGNYVMNITGYISTTVQVYEGSPGLTHRITQVTGSSVEVLLDADYVYYICVGSKLGGTTGNINISAGAVLNTSTISYPSIGYDQSKYYKYIPDTFTGTYSLQSNKSTHAVTCYDSNLEMVEKTGNNVFLTKNNVYYIKIANTGTSALAGELSVLYQYDITAFNSKLEIKTDGYKQYYAYVIEGSNVSGLNMYVTVMLNNVVISSATYVGQEEIVVDLSNANLTSGTNTINASIVLNGNSQNPATVPTQSITTNNYTLISSSFTGANLYISCGTAPTGVKNISIASSVDVLIIDASASQTYSNIYFNIQSASKPLVIYFVNVGKPLTFVAPQRTDAIISSRDLIINCLGSVTLKGGVGQDNGVLYDVEGKAGINMHDNNLYLNGTGAISFYGGNGGTVDGDFTGGARAGNAGSAVEVGNLVVNVSSFYARGGDGGNGGNGPNGANGANGVDNGEVGSDGSYGGYGADGGNGGAGVWILDDYFVIYTTNIGIYGGNGGNGGAGGKGGNGGNGAKGKFGKRGANGGDGGNGGIGGNKGIGSVAISDYDINKIIYFDTNGVESSLPSSILNLFTDGDNGIPGSGGAGGTGGAGGEPGVFNSNYGADGSDGRPGVSGT